MADFYNDNELNNDTGKLPTEEQDNSILFIEQDEEPQQKEEVQTSDKSKNKGGIWGELFDCFETFCYALVLMMLLFVFVFRFVTVDGHSMDDTLQHQDKLIISDLFYTPKTGDIVVLETEGKFGETKHIIKRVIATEGQKVEIEFAEWKVTVDGVLLDEDEYVKKSSSYMAPFQTVYTNNPSDIWVSYFGEGVDREFDENGILHKVSFTVPKDKVFYMGDNRNHSTDAREKGYLSEDSILGRVLLRIGPFSNFGRV